MRPTTDIKTFEPPPKGRVESPTRLPRSGPLPLPTFRLPSLFPVESCRHSPRLRFPPSVCGIETFWRFYRASYRRRRWRGPRPTRSARLDYIDREGRGRRYKNHRSRRRSRETPYPTPSSKFPSSGPAEEGRYPSCRDGTSDRDVRERDRDGRGRRDSGLPFSEE